MLVRRVDTGADEFEARGGPQRVEARRGCPVEVGVPTVDDTGLLVVTGLEGGSGVPGTVGLEFLKVSPGLIPPECILHIL